jgi:2-polyprenyl-3-methyl-5-hydroxy-6-metoxy-1,4-benzoquinol methylase
MTSTDTGRETRRDALVERLFGAALGAFDLFGVYVGRKLGFYRALADDGPLRPRELAAATGTNERYVREWLEQQAVTGILEVEDATAADGTRRYTLPEGHDEALLDADSLSFIAPVAPAVIGSLGQARAVVEAFRTGRGVGWEDYGEDARQAQADSNRPQFLNRLGSEWIPAMPDVDARLLADPPARVADVACGGGWSSIAIARAYPNVRVDGLDLDAASIELARANADEAGLGDRVHFQLRDAADPELAGRYDLVTVFEAIHDMSQPVEALRAMRGLAADTGAVLVVDERVADSFTAPGDDVERYMYGWSILSCLPTGMASQPSAATGTVMRADTLARYASEAGFSRVEVLPVEHDFFRLYRLHA